MPPEDERERAAHAPGPRQLGGRYRLDVLIGRGGMGSVFAGEQLALGRPCALKLLEARLCDQPVARQRFAREARRAGRIVHENVVAAMDYDECDGVPFLVMELLDGETLRSLLRREGALPLGRALSLAMQMCRGLGAAHRLNIVHRDLTPNNVYLTRRADGSELVKLLDFGIAKSSEDVEELTADGTLLGSLRYMAPEQLREPSAVDARTDLYAVGLLLYEMLAGRPACVPRDQHAAVQQALYERPPPLSEPCPQLPDTLLRLIERAIDPAPERRFGSAEELLEALEACLVPWGAAPAEAVTKSTSDERVRAWGAAGAARRQRKLVPGVLLLAASAAFALIVRVILPGPGPSATPALASAPTKAADRQQPIPALPSRAQTAFGPEATVGAAPSPPTQAPAVAPSATLRRVPRVASARALPTPATVRPADGQRLDFDRDNPY